MCNNSLSEVLLRQNLVGCAKNESGLSQIPKLKISMFIIDVVEEHSIRIEAVVAKRCRVYRRENVGMSNLQS